MDLREKVAVVTGGGRGVGRAVALALGRRGAKVVVHFNQSAAAARAVVEEIRGFGGAAIGIGADLDDESSPRQLIESAVGEWGRLDVLVNNAAIYPVHAAAALPLETWKQTLRVNLTGPFLCCQAAYPHFRRLGGGKIVFVSSIAGMRGSGNAHYVASKSGLLGLTLALAREWAMENICVNAVAPGVLDTDMTVQIDPGMASRVDAEIPLGRMGRPDEVADAVCFLLQNDYATGSIVNLSGGRHLAI